MGRLYGPNGRPLVGPTGGLMYLNGPEGGTVEPPVGGGEAGEGGTSGSLVHGQPFFLTGTGFGTKSPATPDKYDDFSGGATGETVTNGWTATSNCTAQDGPHNNLDIPIYADDPVRGQSALAAQCRFHDLSGSSHYTSASQIKFTLNTSAASFYLDAYMQLKNVTGTNETMQNFKWLAVLYNGNNSRLLYQQNFGVDCNVVGDSSLLAGSYDYRFPGAGGLLPQYVDTWIHIQMLGRMDSTRDANDGILKFWVDHTLLLNLTNFRYRGSGWPEGSGLFDAVEVGQYRTPSNETDECTTNWANVYFDTSWARLELGNDAVYDDCTIREIQKPLTWGTTALSFTVNKGALSAGAVHLFVFDSTGAQVGDSTPLVMT